jgi:hypothetical protein
MAEHGERSFTSPAAIESPLRRFLPLGLHHSPDSPDARRTHCGWRFDFILDAVLTLWAPGDMLLNFSDFTL